MAGWFVVVAAAFSASQATAATTVTLAPGEAVAISGSDVVCVFGGPKNEIGVSCLHTKSSGVYSFRMDERDVRVYARKDGRTKEIGRWVEPTTIAQPQSPDVASFKRVARLRSGGAFRPGGLDVSCEVDVLKGNPIAVCAKVASGKPVGYGASLGVKGVIVADYAKQRLVFTGNE